MLLRPLYRRIGVCYNDVGVPFSLAKHLSLGQQITLVDVGARSGDFTRSIASFCDVKRGLLVEVQPQHASNLRRDFRPPRFAVEGCAASDRHGTVQLEVNEFDATTSILPMDRCAREFNDLDVRLRETIECPADTLDAIVERNGITTVDLLKIDVQGAEHLVLAGAHGTLSKTFRVWCEVSFRPLYHRSAVFEDIYRTMHEKGFALVEIEPAYRGPGGELLQADALFVRIR
ncbi:MAG: FkbM family methyltransferase [Chthoniobacterales bacterium]